MGLGEMLEFIRDGPSLKFTSSLIKNIKCIPVSDPAHHVGSASAQEGGTEVPLHNWNVHVQYGHWKLFHWVQNPQVLL